MVTSPLCPFNCLHIISLYSGAKLHSAQLPQRDSQGLLPRDEKVQRALQRWAKLRYYKFEGNRKLLSLPEFGGSISVLFLLISDFCLCGVFFLPFFYSHPFSRKAFFLKVNIFCLFVEFLTNRLFYFSKIWVKGFFRYLWLPF